MADSEVNPIEKIIQNAKRDKKVSNPTYLTTALYIGLENPRNEIPTRDMVILSAHSVPRSKLRTWSATLQYMGLEFPNIPELVLDFCHEAVGMKELAKPYFALNGIEKLEIAVKLWEDQCAYIPVAFSSFLEAGIIQPNSAPKNAQVGGIAPAYHINQEWLSPVTSYIDDYKKKHRNNPQHLKNLEKLVDYSRKRYDKN